MHAVGRYAGGPFIIRIGGSCGLVIGMDFGTGQ